MSRMQTNDSALWESIYTRGEQPWDAGMPDNHLVEMVKRGEILAGRALDIGCGPGNESIFLASRGFKVVGIDISTSAVRSARRRAERAEVNCEFVVCDALDLPFGQATFDFVLDRACFHFAPEGKRSSYLESLDRVLTDGGKYVLYAASERDANISGPYKFTEEYLRSFFEPVMRIDSIRLVRLMDHHLRPQPYLCVMTHK